MADLGDWSINVNFKYLNNIRPWMPKDWNFDDTTLYYITEMLV